eukprot:9186175-Alexandrium_andersonii.AAC.1
MVERRPRESLVSPAAVREQTPETKAEHNYVNAWAEHLVEDGAMEEPAEAAKVAAEPTEPTPGRSPPTATA